MRYIPVEKCEDCPCREGFNQYHGDYPHGIKEYKHKCFYGNPTFPMIIENTTTGFPEWCPLKGGE